MALWLFGNGSLDFNGFAETKCIPYPHTVKHFGRGLASQRKHVAGLWGFCFQKPNIPPRWPAFFFEQQLPAAANFYLPIGPKSCS